MLIDSYQRQFHYLRLSITDVCNFKCDYCLPDGYDCSNPREFLTIDEIKRLVTAFAELGVSKVRITGGEPGLRKDLAEIIRVVKNVDGVDTVALTTNGYNLETQIENWVDAGLDSLNVSIDSLKSDTFRLITGSNKHQSILKGIDKAISLGVKNVKVNAVLLKQFNENELTDFLQWIKFKPLSLRLIELMETGDNKTYFAKQHVNGEQLKNKIENDGWLPIVKSKVAGPALEYCHPDFQGKIGFILPYSKDFCASCNRLRVSSVGNLHKCLFAEEGLNFRHLLQSSSQLSQLKVWLQTQLDDKKETHFLQDNKTGATKHLAMLGG
ncbi:GTP 3',8-cyclase MoaA [Psychrosphaera sp. B3R10]|uniref:GTP 3',8-cyclase MoaA n=1 Tax=unclassified Psychrosphaera TaxID=2641570 RepID=UPI001C09EAE8|nr:MULTISPECIES: GTP 3',8-cyclase MoaA [unclassified Psychrosphaera]MBU2882026.1 GTP 3',8-cyclase MoaA [Psychrosphaera sp. I2R16]MBU2989843.1 GTP 3',8-cyclase MoaA [Psychrosphaera sp. B3R10]